MSTENDTAKASLADKVKSWAERHLGETFSFREYQLGSIVEVIQNILDGKKITAAELPCGAGKSYIALCVAGVLDEYYNKTTYILVSDVSLFKQYEKDVKSFGLPWGVICGKDNYICQKNGLHFSSSSCQLHDMSLNKLMDFESAVGQGYACAKTCKYIKELKLALTSRVVVMTYQLWFVSNFLMDNSYTGGLGFKPKDVVICDEAHKLSSLVQSTFSPKLDISQLEFYKKVYEFADENGVTGHSSLAEPSKISETFHVMEMVYNSQQYNNEEKRDLLYQLFHRYQNQLQNYNTVMNNIKEESKYAGKGEKKDYIKVLKVGNSIMNEYCSTVVYDSIIKKHGIRNFVPSLISENAIVFNCACEADMVKETFHQKAKSEFLMSATLGNLDVYLNLIGADDWVNNDSVNAFEVPSTFNFDESPIYYSSKCKMSFREKAASMPLLIDCITKICNIHKGEHGIIHTGSYSLSKDIYNQLPADIRRRIVFYDSSKGKNESITTFKGYAGKILMGPSILEGLSFDDDLSRFCIIAKVPYPSLGDNLVRAKMDIYDDWYAYTTINSIIQGVGRSIRSKDDYAKTYVLDGCFADLYAKNTNLFPQYFKDRLKRLVLN